MAFCEGHNFVTHGHVCHLPISNTIIHCFNKEEKKTTDLLSSVTFILAFIYPGFSMAISDVLYLADGDEERNLPGSSRLKVKK